MNVAWIYGLGGGLLIGLAAAIYLLVSGRIMGASGIAGSVADGSAGGAKNERLAFLAGLIGIPAAASFFTEMPVTNVTSNIGLLIVAGALVGFGTRLGSGCTSGHGVCGMSRFSIRSIVATLIYIAAGVVVIVAARFAGVIS